MRYLIVIPAFDEVGTIAEVVSGACQYGPVLVVDDGSSDGTAVAAETAGAAVLEIPRRRGKGAARRRDSAPIRWGWSARRGRGGAASGSGRGSPWRPVAPGGPSWRSGSPSGGRRSDRAASTRWRTAWPSAPTWPSR